MRLLLALLLCAQSLLADRAADQLYEDLLYFYIKNVRPVKNGSDIMQVAFGASLIRIINVEEIGQILTTNVWLEMQWTDHKLVWDPLTYNNITKLHIPSDQIWTPDIILYNNADGNPDITIMVDADVYNDGRVVWKPPAIYKSFCEINIEYFPYDTQTCPMKFGGWSHDGQFLNMNQIPVRPGDVVEEKVDDEGKSYQFLSPGMDISYFHPSKEWDLLDVVSKRHELLYPGCCGQRRYIDVTFEISVRRKPLFYTVNLVIPCLLIAILTTFVFYIPAGDHKITFSISILVALTFNLLVLIDLIPPTSLVIPLMGKYLLFTMFLVGVSIMVSVFTLNLFHRDAATHRMPAWMRWLFLDTLPGLLCIKPQDYDEEESTISENSSLLRRQSSTTRPSPYYQTISQYDDTQLRLSHLALQRGMNPDLIRRMISNLEFIAEHYRAFEDEDQISEDWSYVAMVIDRLFLIMFSLVNITGTVMLIFQAPSLYDASLPMQKPLPIEPLGMGDINITN